MTTHASTARSAGQADRESLAKRFERTRRATAILAEPLAPEDTVVQSMTGASPTKWHLAHTTWFFERFVLREFDDRYVSPNDTYDYLFNSYYNTVGPQHCRPRRGVISRPTLDEVFAFRAHVEQHVHALLDREPDNDALRATIEIGLQHEKQHQELIVTDIKHMLSSNPLLPSPYADETDEDASDDAHARDVPPTGWARFEAGVARIGANPAHGFRFDNETPRHRVFLEPFEIAKRPVTNAEFRAFIEDRGYQRPELWLSMGWATVAEQSWRCPMYWFKDDGGRWNQYTLHRGPVPLRDDEPVCHLSYFEADAYARWAGARLPTEAEWEHAAADMPLDGVTAEERRLHPSPIDPRESHPARFFGDVWEWTSSSYAAYPGYAAPPGALGEYNGKFMCNQYVLRGGSCATPREQVRLTYRNFFPPDARWQFAGLRLARTVSGSGNQPTEARTHVNNVRPASPPQSTEPSIASECAAALAKSPPQLPTKYLYDARGSRLFEQITELPEYTLTRDEMAIFDRHIADIASAIGTGTWVIELGSGDGRKTRRLLDALDTPAGYTPVEISQAALDRSVETLRAEMPSLHVKPIRGDFTGDLDFSHIPTQHRVVFFPGSTIGNFDEQSASALIARFARWVGPGGGLLIGVDLVKPESELIPAYSDARGVTAEFNLNLLDRLNREAGADFERANWTHRASWNAERSRMESQLVSTASQRVNIDGRSFSFESGDAIFTEFSNKYTLDDLRRLTSPFELQRHWLDPRGRFLLAYLEVPT